MIFRSAIVLFVLAFFITVPTAEIFAQESLDKYAYRTNTKNIFRVHYNKKLNKDEILELMVNDQIAQDKFRKSLKLRKVIWATGLTWVGLTTYLATQEEIRDNSWGDYNTAQKVVFVGFLASGAAMVTTMIWELSVRSSSFSKICLPCRAEELGHVEVDQEYLSLSYSGSGLSLSLHF